MTPNLDYLSKTQDLVLDGYTPFFMAGHHIGWVAPTHTAMLLDGCAEVYTMQGSHLTLKTLHDKDIDTRTVALEAGRQVILAAGFKEITSSREYMPVSPTSDPMNIIARRARHNIIFHIPGYGVHMNVYRRTANGAIEVFLGKRGTHKAMHAGCLDQVVGGGVVCGDSYKETMEKEAHEEAGIPATLLGKAVHVKTIMQHSTGVYNKPWLTYVALFDLEVPYDFKPVNQDGEVQDFVCVSSHELLELLDNGQKWKTDSAAVAADFAIRHGLLKLPAADEARIQSYLSRPLPFDR